MLTGCGARGVSGFGGCQQVLPSLPPPPPLRGLGSDVQDHLLRGTGSCLIVPGALQVLLKFSVSATEGVNFCQTLKIRAPYYYKALVIISMPTVEGV